MALNPFHTEELQAATVVVLLVEQGLPTTALPVNVTTSFSNLMRVIVFLDNPV